ncbi:MAG: hypothetical protein ABID83_01865 [Candidatus Omnitrophota bacterium]
MKAIVLLSGGLDSSLALKMIYDQGLDVLALHFSSPFCQCDGSKGCGSSARRISEFVGTRLRSVFLGEEYLEIVKNPRHGRGKNMNPCIDCRILKFVRAKQIMAEERAAFIVTGEVLGQRPMSQHRRALDLIEKESGLQGLVVRPLSAKILPPTIPEKEGWIDRSAFLGFHGRTRKPQIKLARDLGINDYPCPAGGCLLTYSSFCGRIRDLLDHTDPDMNDVELLKTGRHFRLTPEFKLAVGRDELENNKLIALAQPGDLIFNPIEVTGPTGIGRGHCGDATALLAASIIARYSDSGSGECKISFQEVNGGKKDIIAADGIDEASISKLRI